MAETNLSKTSAEIIPSYIILGAGVFGASTAYHLIKKYPSASITLVDRTTGPCQNAASWDWNKVVRADYEDPFYMRLALEAMDFWTEDVLFKPYFHRNGAVWIMPNPEYPERVARNYKELGANLDFEIFPAAELRKRYDGLFEGTDLTCAGGVFLNKSSGWAEAKDALARLIDEAVKANVRNIALDVGRLIFNEQGACEGVEAHNGEQLKADRIILCTGAYTAKLLADSVPNRKDWQIGNRLTAAAVVEGTIKLDSARLEKFIKGPVFIHNVLVEGETMPPGEDGILKFVRSVPFKNKTFHLPTGDQISSPPEGPHYNQWSAPQGLKDEIENVRKGLYGDLTTDIPFDTYRICWEATSPDVNFFITQHPIKHLYIATGGSFHGWKMMPILGKYVVQMLEGALSEECEERWAWDRPMPKVHKGYVPQRELKDI